MGTRAIIKFEGKPMLATHWDGYPSSLGVDLVSLKQRTPEKIVEVASRHNIDFISPKFAPDKPVKIPSKLYKDGKYIKGFKVTKFLTEEEMNKLGSAIGTSFTRGKIDYKISEIAPMSQYGDFAEWEYDIRDGEVFARRLHGSYQEKRVASSWTNLPTPASSRKFEKDIGAKEEQEYIDREINKSKKNPIYGAIQISKELASSSSGKIPSFEKDVSKVDETYFPQVSSYKDKLSPEDKKMIKVYLKVPKVRKLIGVGKGWHYESLRHRLASYGIKTNFAKGNLRKLNSMYKMARRRR